MIMACIVHVGNKIQDFGCETKEGYCLEAVGTGVQTIEWT